MQIENVMHFPILENEMSDKNQEINIAYLVSIFDLL